MPKILGVITARGGSKGIPGKNIKPLLGKPLIAYTIEAAQKSGIFDRLILSTDDEAIASVAKKYGIEVPFLRPAELAEDKTPHLPVMQHAVQWMREKDDYIPDYVAILQPTAPLRQPEHLKEAWELLSSRGADSVISVTEIPGHSNPMWAIKIDENSFGTLFVSGEPIRKRIPRRQELPKAYVNSGAVYIFKTELLFHPETPNFYGDKVAAYIIDDRFNANIDLKEDWEKAEKALKQIQDSRSV